MILKLPVKIMKFPRTFFANNQSGAQRISFYLTGNYVWHTNYLTTKHGELTLATCHGWFVRRTFHSLISWSHSSLPRFRSHSLASSPDSSLARSRVLLSGRTQRDVDPDSQNGLWSQRWQCSVSLVVPSTQMLGWLTAAVLSRCKGILFNKPLAPAWIISISLPKWRAIFAHSLHEWILRMWRSFTCLKIFTSTKI